MLAGLAARPGVGVLASNTRLPLAVALTLLIDGAILSTVWRCVQGRGQGRPGRRSRRTACQATSGAALDAPRGGLAPLRRRGRTRRLRRGRGPGHPLPQDAARVVPLS